MAKQEVIDLTFQSNKNDTTIARHFNKFFFLNINKYYLAYCRTTSYQWVESRYANEPI